MSLNIDFGTISDSIGLTVDDMIDLLDEDVVEEQRWELDSKEIKTIFSVVKSIVGKSPITKCVRLEATKVGLVISATDSLSFLQYEAGILNSGQILQGAYTILFSSIEPLLAMLPKNKTVIYERDGFLYVQLIGGSFPIATVNADVYTNWDKVGIGAKIGKIDTENMQTVIRDLLPYISSSEQVQDRKITFDVEDGQTYAFASYKWSIVRTPVQAEGVANVDLRYKDLQILKQLLQASSGENVHMYSVEGMNAIAVQSLNYTYYFVKGTVAPHPLTRKLLNSLMQDCYRFKANYNHFLQVLKFANQNQDILSEVKVRTSSQSLFIDVKLTNGIVTTFRIMGNSSTQMPEISVELNKEVGLTTLKAVSMAEAKSSTEIDIVFSKDMSYIGFCGISQSLISVGKS